MYSRCPLTTTAPLARAASLSSEGANVRGRAGHRAVGHPERYRRGRDLRRQGNGRVGQAHDRVHHAPLLRPRAAGRFLPIQVRLFVRLMTLSLLLPVKSAAFAQTGVQCDRFLSIVFSTPVRVCYIYLKN